MVQKQFKTVFKIVFLLISLSASGQNKYWVYLKDKGVNAFEVRSEYLQVSVNKDYVIQLERIAKVEYQSRWLNALTINIEDTFLLNEVERLSFVQFVRPVAQLITTNLEVEAIHSKSSLAVAQINGLALAQNGITGKGVKVGIIDGGFYKADLDDALLKPRSQIMAFRDYVTPKNINPFHGRESFLDWHGTAVWKMISGYDANRSITFGLANDAQFYLARTDHGKNESRVEEDYLVAALEWMDSLGVKLVNLSLGYARGFDNPEEDHHPSEVDGKSAALTQAVQIAAEQRGMIIINSAGNEGGDKNWQILSIPADAKDAITVGATRFNNGAKAGYSSIGPEILEYVKPDISCYSSSGTSFSAPVITGLVACMLQIDSSLSPLEIKDLLIRSSNLYPYANNYIGYGVPNVDKLIQLIKNIPTSSDPEKVIVKSNSYQLKTSSKEVVVFHKKDNRNVVLQEVMKVKKEKLRVVKGQGVKQSTVLHGDKVLEIFWE